MLPIDYNQVSLLLFIQSNTESTKKQTQTDLRNLYYYFKHSFARYIHFTEKTTTMSQHFLNRVATFEGLGHKGPITGWEAYDFVSLEEATRDLPIPSISTRKWIT